LILQATVVDASALVEVLLQTPRASAILRAVGTSEMVAPDLINVEVLSALRRLVRQSLLAPARADQAVMDLAVTPIRHFPAHPLVDVIWRLRHNLSAYDACYVALAGALDCSLVSADARLARVPHLPVRVNVPGDPEL
jgi:predicted nucleic acid-binding protein